jgi:hypothetical protein
MLLDEVWPVLFSMQANHGLHMFEPPRHGPLKGMIKTPRKSFKKLRDSVSPWLDFVTDIFLGTHLNIEDWGISSKIRRLTQVFSRRAP